MAVKRPKTAAEYLDEEVPRHTGRECFWCRTRRDEIRQLARKKLKRPDLPAVAIWRALKKADSSVLGESSFRRHMVEHEPVLWEKLIAQG